MFSEGGFEANAARVSAPAPSTSGSASIRVAASPAASGFSGSVPALSPASIRASRVALSLLLAEAAAFALAAASGKIPAFLFTAVRALLTF
jgi:hypothetical protein